jgi:hypothetical protein
MGRLLTRLSEAEAKLFEMQDSFTDYGSRRHSDVESQLSGRHSNASK